MLKHCDSSSFIITRCCYKKCWLQDFLQNIYFWPNNLFKMNDNMFLVLIWHLLVCLEILKNQIFIKIFVKLSSLYLVKILLILYVYTSCYIPWFAEIREPLLKGRLSTVKIACNANKIRNYFSIKSSWTGLVSTRRSIVLILMTWNPIPTVWSRTTSLSTHKNLTVFIHNVSLQWGFPAELINNIFAWSKCCICYKWILAVCHSIYCH